MTKKKNIYIYIVLADISCVARPIMAYLLEKVCPSVTNLMSKDLTQIPFMAFLS